MTLMAKKRREIKRNKHKRAVRDGCGGRRRSQSIEDFDLPELQKARVLWRNHRYPEALNLFDRTVRRNPRNVLALVDASRAFGQRYEIARAEALLDRLIELAGDRADIQHMAGQTYRMTYRPDKAIACFERALALDRCIPDAMLELAMLYERRSRIVDATVIIEQLLKQIPDYAEAKLVQARLLRRDKGTSQAQTLLYDLTADDKVHWATRAQGWAELARLLDSEQQYDDAMTAMRECKNILSWRSGDAVKGAEQERLRLNGLLEGLTAAHFDCWRADGAKFGRQNVALLTGPPRSGTTLLEKMLDAHPGLVSSDERDAFPRYVFAAMLDQSDANEQTPSPKRLDGVSRESLLTERRRYLHFMEQALGEPIGDRVHLDKNPSILRTIPGVLRLFPECKLLITIRDPRDVILSCFMQFMPVNTVSVNYHTIEGAAKRYVDDMNVWLKLREIIGSPYLEVRYEDIVANMEREARRSAAFFDLPWNDAMLDYRKRLTQRQVDSPTYEAVAQPLYTKAIGRWRHYEKYLTPVLDVLEPYVKAFGYSG